MNKQPGVMTRYNSFQVLQIVETLVYIALGMTMMQYPYEHITGKVTPMLEHLTIVSVIEIDHMTHQNELNRISMTLTLAVIMER